MSDDHLFFEKLNKDLKTAAKAMSRNEAAYLVSSYYREQENRIRAAAQARALEERGEPCALTGWMRENEQRLEGWIKTALDLYSGAHPVGQWARSHVGVGPVIAAGLLAHIDFTIVRSAGQIWRYAGLDPTSRWEKGQKRPWNAELKTLCAFKLGESFVKVSNRPGAYYGHQYRAYKERIAAMNEAGEYADQAAARLETQKIGKSTELYKHLKAGRLPPAQIHARARRYAVKLFLAHLFEVGFRHTHPGEPVPLPYPVAHMDHTHVIPVSEADAARDAAKEAA